MKILNDIVQGSDEWKAHRAQTFNASEAPAMFGVSPYLTRNELLRQKYAGSVPEADPATQRLYDAGHEAEAGARPIAEAIIEQELYPVTVTDDDGRLSASLDGMTMAGDIIFEHKLFSREKAAAVVENRCPEQDYPQVQQQLYITGAERCLYAVSDGTEQNFVSCWVEPDPEYQQKVIAGWEQFQQDLDNYEPPQDEPAAVGAKMETLPALHIEMKGEVTASNLAEYKDHALAVFKSINTDLQTDQDFADAEQCVKWCSDIESKLDAAKQHALSQTADIDALFRDIDDIKESARQKRLELDKLVKQRKQSIREEIRREAEKALADHEKKLEERLDNRVAVPAPKTDFAAAMKNKRTIQSLRDSVDQVLANAKIEANELADAIQANLKAFDEIAADYQSLFPDLNQIVQKAPDDFKAAIKLRIQEHKEAEEKRLEAERERIRKEEQAKAEAEERRKAEEQAKAEQQAQGAQTEKPTPAASTPPEQPAAQSTVPWTVTATLRVDAKPNATREAIETHAQKVLEDAGLNVEHITCEKKQRAA